MQRTDDPSQGELIQRYVRAKWGKPPNKAAATVAAERLEPGVVDRVDALGMDAEQLLDMRPARVISELRRLERVAEREDARALAGAGRVRLREEAAIDDGSSWRGNRVRAGRYHPATGRAGHRQRGKR